MYWSLITIKHQVRMREIERLRSEKNPNTKKREEIESNELKNLNSKEGEEQESKNEILILVHNDLFC